MKLSAWHCLFFVTLVLACEFASANSIVKRQASGGLEGFVQGIINTIANLPIIGSPIASVLNSIVDAIKLFEIATNGAIARLLGGALPCTISLNGTECSGITSNGGFANLLVKVINNLPPFAFPQVFKDFARWIILGVISPLVDAVLGGVAVNR